MKMNHFFLTLMVMGVILGGCKKETEPSKERDGGIETKEDYEAKRLRMEREKDEVYKKMKEQLDRTQEQIDELKAEAKKTGKDKDPEFRERVERLEKKEIDIRANVEKIKNASLAAWEDLKPRVGQALDDLFDGVESAINEFRFSQQRNRDRERKKE